MAEKWRNDLINLLKHLEKSYPQSNKIHEFRRGIESCNGKKAEKLLPQLEIIYEECKTHASEGEKFIGWLNKKQFRLMLGLREVILVDTIHPEQFVQLLLWTLSHFDPALDERLPEEQKKSSNSILTSALGLPVSGKQMKQAMKRVQNMDSAQLGRMVKKVPQSKLDSLSQSEGAEEMVERLKEDPRAQIVAEKVRAVQNIGK